MEGTWHVIKIRGATAATTGRAAALKVAHTRACLGAGQ